MPVFLDPSALNISDNGENKEFQNLGFIICKISNNAGFILFQGWAVYISAVIADWQQLRTLQFGFSS